MGARHVDNIPIANAWPRTDRVAVMLKEDWKVISVCRSCGLKLHIDLRAVVATMGPDFSLWNARTKCRKVGCHGHAEFEAMPPRGSLYRRLIVARSERLP
jgi:hypothetical protein